MNLELQKRVNNICIILTDNKHTATFNQHTLMANAHVVGQPFYLVTVSGCKLIAHCSLLIAQLQENGENWNHCRQVVPFQKQNMHDTRSLQSKLDSMHMHITIFNNRCNLGTGWPQGDGLVVCTEYKNSHALHNMSQGCKSLGCLWKRLGSLRKKSMWPNKYVRIPSVQVSRPFL